MSLHTERWSRSRFVFPERGEGMVSEHAPSTQTGFQYRPQTDGCHCPIHRSRDREPFTAPLGLPFADRITAEPITAEQAADVYDAHHSYMDGVAAVNLAHHGVYFQNNLVGAITYRTPLGRRKLHFDADGRLCPRPHDDQTFAQLPETLRSRARRLIESVDEDALAATEVVGGTTVVEVSRICLGVRMPNLASAALAASQERFATSPDCPDDTQYLLTFVRADYEGSMIQALRDKGWRCTGWSEPHQASNRDQRGIRDRYKWRFLCPLDHDDRQATIDEWTPSESSSKM